MGLVVVSYGMADVFLCMHWLSGINPALIQAMDRGTNAMLSTTAWVLHECVLLAYDSLCVAGVWVIDAYVGSIEAYWASCSRLLFLSWMGCSCGKGVVPWGVKWFLPAFQGPPLAWSFVGRFLGWFDCLWSFFLGYWCVGSLGSLPMSSGSWSVGRNVFGQALTKCHGSLQWLQVNKTFLDIMGCQMDIFLDNLMFMLLGISSIRSQKMHALSLGKELLSFPLIYRSTSPKLRASLYQAFSRTTDLKGIST